MKDLIVIEGEKQLTQSDIDLLEQKLQIKLPIEYKKFLLLHNGGHPEKDVYTFIDSRMLASDLAWFLAYYEGEYENLLEKFLILKDRIPKGFLPIARDSGSNQICLGINGTNHGKVYFWKWDEAAPYGEEPTFDNMYLLANSFIDFINGLYKFVDLKKDDRGKKIRIYAHDRYSLSLSTEARKYGDKVMEFFNKAPFEVEDYIIEEAEETKDLLLWYEVKSEGKRYFRKVSTDGQVEDYQM